jgi:glycosyltransferase involved in cell wall biosynthesis
VGIRVAVGEWIAFLDADDIWLPEGLQARWRVAASEPDAGWIAADFKMWNLDGSMSEQGHHASGNISRHMLERAFTSGRPMRLTRPVSELLSCAVVWTGTVLVRAALLREVGGFNESLRGPEDLHLWLRLAHRSDLFFVPEVVALYRQHPRELTREPHVPGSWDVVAYRLLWDDPSFRPYRTALKQRLAATYQGIAYHHRRQREAWPAARAAVKALRYTPASVTVWRNLAAALLRA